MLVVELELKTAPKIKYYLYGLLAYGKDGFS
jgi:hypothetical protein